MLQDKYGTSSEKTVLSAMVVTMTRVNAICRDLSLQMNLVANNDLVIFIGVLTIQMLVIFFFVSKPNRSRCGHWNFKL
jgi:hypothetical protein